MTKNFNPSRETYDALHEAFDFFNDRLFGGKLPPVMMTIHRKKNARGYFWAEQFREKNDASLKVDEIALNPESMGRTTKDVLSTLVHEMVHLEQQHFGKPGKGGYHNKEWGDMMDEVGLEPTSTGHPGGARTGKKVTHMIVAGEPFDMACDALLARGLDLSWFTVPQAPVAKAKDLSKVKHTCPDCDNKVWGKLGIRVFCGDCDVQMLAEEDDDA